ncbi:hypothetical protein [Sediminibacterium sp.]|uniref:TolB family protein n=1 Tax=Sediminibacterium sp. TaxID=1917865 RepID=UPI0025D2728B|nr:hypothetical protein [Sediminibacterium sp.]MBW0176411.1 hypothetical protein [Sediminibacterium sp.]
MKIQYKVLMIFFSFLCSSILIAQVKISFTEPPLVPTLFQAGVVSTGIPERDFALSPDETELFYTIQSPLGYFQTIVYMRKDLKGIWSNPQIASFAGNYSDLEPTFSPDGKRLLFSSNRPLTGDKAKDFDIWYVEKQGDSWSAIPQNIGAPVNTEANEFYPSLTKSGNLYFTASYKNGVGREDIYVAIWTAGKFNQPVALDTAVNTKVDEFNAFVSPDEDFILFTSYGRKDDMGRSDLYITQKDKSGNWQAAKHISILNSNRIDYCPFVSFDKKKMFFTSERNILKQVFDKKVTLEDLEKTFRSPQNGSGDIYWISFDKVLESLK